MVPHHPVTKVMWHSGIAQLVKIGIHKNALTGTLSVSTQKISIQGCLYSLSLLKNEKYTYIIIISSICCQFAKEELRWIATSSCVVMVLPLILPSILVQVRNPLFWFGLSSENMHLVTERTKLVILLSQ